MNVEKQNLKLMELKITQFIKVESYKKEPKRLFFYLNKF
jgi:hypothetical protein